MPADPLADQGTRHLFRNLKNLVDAGYILYGQEFPTDFQWATEGWLDHNPEDSDCKDVVGRHPGVFGADFHYFLEKTQVERWVHLRSVKAAHSRGALVTFDWHLSSPVGRGGAFYVNEGNKNLLADITFGLNDRDECAAGPDSMCAWYFSEVEKVLDIVRELGFPIAFRPLHEMSGFWFWWGNLGEFSLESAGYQEFAVRYKQLYRALVKYTRAHGVHNLLYIWSPSNEANFDFYPGDDWVDIVGLDIYEQGTAYGPSLDAFSKEIDKVTEYANTHGKIAILAETGFRMGYPEVETFFWTEKVLAPLMARPSGPGVAWVLSWMNAQWEKSPYTPYEGMQNLSAMIDFRGFFRAQPTLFEGDFSGIETAAFKIHADRIVPQVSSRDW